MSMSIQELKARQLTLQERAAFERTELVIHFKPLDRSFQLADKGVNAFKFLKSTPILWTSAFAVLAHFKPKLASKALALGWGAMKLLKTAKNLI